MEKKNFECGAFSPFPLRSEWFLCVVRILQLFFPVITIVYISVCKCVWVCMCERSNGNNSSSCQCVRDYIWKILHTEYFFLLRTHRERIRLKINWWKNGKGIYLIYCSICGIHGISFACLFVIMSMVCMLCACASAAVCVAHSFHLPSSEQ